VTSYPVAKPFEKMQMVIEPMAALTVAPNINAKDNAIPNEDSQDAQIDALNLFNPNRFPGKDRIEDQSRATYGLRTGFYGYEGSYLDVFAGQSYRFNEDDNPFPRGSGLNDQQSDLVGQIAGMYDGRYGMNYRFQLASDDLSSQRHEFDGYANWERFTLNSRYLYATSLEDTSIDESREQIEGIASIDITKSWRFNTGALYDLGEDPGLRKAAIGLDFMGCCMSFSVLAERNLTTDSSGDNGTEIKFRIGLDHLGQIESGSSSYWNNRRMTDSK
jgi:LPS-assembly protein